MQQPQPEALEETVGKLFIQPLGGGQLRDLLPLFNEGADYVALEAVAKVLFDIAVGALTQLAADKLGLDLLPALGHLIKHAEGEVAVDYKRQGPRNRRCGHYKDVYPASFIGHFTALGNAETLLLVTHK